jgi:hypothetical protein
LARCRRPRRDGWIGRLVTSLDGVRTHLYGVVPPRLPRGAQRGGIQIRLQSSRRAIEIATAARFVACARVAGGRGTRQPGFIPNADRVYPRVISALIWAGMRESDVERLVATIEAIVGPRRLSGPPTLSVSGPNQT